jgi:hypothetical protein
MARKEGEDKPPAPPRTAHHRMTHPPQHPMLRQEPCQATPNRSRTSGAATPASSSNSPSARRAPARGRRPENSKASTRAPRSRAQRRQPCTHNPTQRRRRRPCTAQIEPCQAHLAGRRVDEASPAPMAPPPQSRQGAATAPARHRRRRRILAHARPKPHRARAARRSNGETPAAADTSQALPGRHAPTAARGGAEGGEGWPEGRRSAARVAREATRGPSLEVLCAQGLSSTACRR